MRRKGIVVETIFAIFGIGFVVFILAFFVAKPFGSGFTEEHAKVIASSLVADISALSISDSGSVKKVFSKPWDIKISNQELEVIYEKDKSFKTEINSNLEVPDTVLSGVKKLTIERTAKGIALRGEYA